MNDFHVGQEVVCIDDSPGPYPNLMQKPLVHGKVYVVIGMHVFQEGIFKGQIGISIDGGRMWRASRFRSTMKKQTDISALEKLLNTKSLKELIPDAPEFARVDRRVS